MAVDRPIRRKPKSVRRAPTCLAAGSNTPGFASRRRYQSILKGVATVEITLIDPLATRDLGRRIGNLLSRGTTVLLYGDLGAGKTTLVQGLADGLGCQDEATSPTFALISELPGRLSLRHIDLYRLDAADLAFIGADEWFEDDFVVAIEWAERLGPYTPADAIHIRLNETDFCRRAILAASGQSAYRIVARLCQQTHKRSKPTGDSP